MNTDTKGLITTAGAVLAVGAGAAVALSGLGSHWGWWNFRTGFAVLKWAAVGGLLAAAVCSAGLFWALSHRTQGLLFISAAGLAIGLTAGGLPASWAWTARHVPVINDITTDTQNPPEFSAVLPLRTEATSPAAYPGPETAAQQLKAYPYVQPLITAMPAAAALEEALSAARKLGWTIVETDRKTGRIEAVDTTFWFGFRDDIVIRVTPAPNGSRVDMRSHSRVGRSDLGTNARRIRTFMKTMSESWGVTSG